MNSLVSVEPTTGAILTNSDFWPDIDTGELRAAVRLDGEVSEGRLAHAATEAMARVNDELADWRSTQQQRGYNALTDIPSDTIAGVSVRVQRYRRAVYCTAKALLIEGYRDIDTTREGEKHAEALSTQIDAAWRDSQWALRDVMGLPRCLAEVV